MWHCSVGVTDVPMPAPSTAPCVKGGVGLFGSISTIERILAEWGVSASVCGQTGTQTAVTHTWPHITLTWFAYCWCVNSPLRYKWCHDTPIHLTSMRQSCPGLVAPPRFLTWCQWPNGVVGSYVRVEDCWHGCVLSTVKQEGDWKVPQHILDSPP